MKSNYLRLRRNAAKMNLKSASAIKSSRSRILVGSAAVLAASAMLITNVAPARGASLIWDVQPGDGAAIQDGNLGFTTNLYQVWANGLGNWNNGGVDTVWNNATPDDAIFGGGSSGIARTVALGSDITAGTLTFNTPFSGLYTISTETFGLRLNTGIIANETARIRSGVGGSVLLGANNNWSVVAGKTLTVDSNIGEAVASTLTKSAAGTLIIGGTGSYTGGTNVDGGILQANSAASLGTVGNITFGGGTLQYTKLSAATLATDYSARIKNSTAAIAIDTNGENVLFGGAIDSSNTGGLTKLGAGTLVLSGATSFAGAFTVNEGLVVSTGVISGATGLTKEGNGTLVLRGTNTYTGVTTLNGGITLMAPLVNDGAVLGATGATNNTIVNSGATLAWGPDALGSGGIGNPAELITINGDGFRNNGALRGFMGVNTNAVVGVVTMGSAARIQNDQAGTFQLNAAFNVSSTLTAGGVGFVSINGLASGAADINHYGFNGFRLAGVGAGQSYSGTINSSLGEIRADTGNAVLANTPYADVAALNLKDSWLRMVFGAAAGAPTAGDSPDSKFSTTAPITMSTGQIYIDNTAFSSTSTNLYDYAVVQHLGDVTINSGHNRIGFRSADAGTVAMTLNSITVPNANTTLELFVDGLVGTALGAGPKHRIFNTAIAADVPFVGGWAYTFTGTQGTGGEFVKYDFTGGNGYTALTGSGLSIAAAAATDNVRPTANQTGFGTKTINSLNIAGNITIGAAGDNLTITSGGLMSSVTGNTIAASTITSGSGTLYDIAIVSHNISSDITGAIDLVKTGAGTTSYLTANSYTGKTYINEGIFRGVIGAKSVALGANALILSGSPNAPAAFENDEDFTRALGTGAGQVSIIGGGGVGGGSAGFNAYGAPINVNFGGAGAAITWGSANFNPGILGLNSGGGSTHAVTFVNPIDLGGEQRYIRVDGGSPAGERGALVIMGGDLSNGSIVKRGGGLLVLDNAKTYQGGTIVNQGTLWLRGTGTAGANVTGNDIQVNADAVLKIESPDNIGSNQLIILQNGDNSTPAAITFGAGYGTGSALAFHSFSNTPGDVLATGGNNVLIANTGQSAQARRVAVVISGNNGFQADVLGQIRTVAPTIEAWFGADTGNGTFTGTVLSPSGGTGTQTGTLTAAPAYRLGGHVNNGGVLTIANANVLTDTALGVPTPLIVGAPDSAARDYTGGTIYIPKSQSYSGQVIIGANGILQVGENGALGTGTFDINLRGGELRLDVAGGNFGGAIGTQYAARNLNLLQATGTVRTTTLGGGGFNTVQLGNVTFGDAARALQVLSIGTNFTDLAVNNVTLFNSANTATFVVGNDNSFQAGVGILTINGTILDQPTGLQSIQKNNGGVLVLTNAGNTYDGGTIVTQGRVVLTTPGAAGPGAISMATATGRRGDIEFRGNDVGPIVYPNAVTTSGGDGSSTRAIVVGPTGVGSEDKTVQIPSLTINNAGGYTVGGTGSSALFFDGANGYKLEVTGGVTLTSSIALRNRGAMLTLSGVVSGAATSLLEKNEQGTLVLNNANTYLGTTTISNGYIVLGNDSALGAATTDVTFRNNVFSQILASGARTISRNFINTGTGSIQSLGGLDAGAKTFSGNVNLSTRGMSLTAFAGGDTTFSGVITDGAGTFGIQKEGNGTVILNPSTGTGNTYDGGTTVVQGTLIGQAQATSGSPFGTGGITMADGELQLTGRATATTTTATVLTTGGGARIGVDATAGGATTFAFSSLARSGSGSITFVPTTGSLNTNEIFTFSTAPTLVNGIVGPWAVATTSGVNNAANYVTMSGSNVVAVTYAGADFNTSTATQVINPVGAGLTLTGNASAYAFRADGNVNLGTFTLNLGDTLTTPGSTNKGAGMILNAGADITGGVGGKVNIGNAALNVYVDNAGVSSLNAPITNTRNNATNTLSTSNVPATAVLTKFGAGTLEIGAVQTFQGNIELNRGTLSLTAPNVLPTFGNLNAVTGSILTMSPGTSVVLNNNNQEVGNLSAVNPSNSFQFSAGTLDLGTATLTVGRESSSQTFNAQILGGAGSRILKVGTGTLTLDNINGNKASTLTTLDIAQGGVSAWVNDQSWATPTPIASAIPASTTILLRGGTFTALGIGDSTSNQQRINIGNNIVHSGADSVFTTNRATGSGSNKLLTFNNLTLDVQRLQVTNGNGFVPRIDGTTTLVNHARLQVDNSMVIAGAITDGGKGFTLNKIGGGDLEIGGDSSTTWTGGTVVTGGTLIFGTRGLDDVRTPGTTVVNTATSNAGTGDIIVNLGSAIRITSPANILAGQEVRIYGSDDASTTRVDLLTDAPITDYHLRSLTNGSVALSLSEGLWTTPLDEARMGSGTWGISALSNTFYTATTLGATVDNRYFFNGTSAGTLTIVNSNVLTGTASVELGKSPIFAGANPSGSGANIRLYGDQNYTGSTTIFRAADTGSIAGILEITGDSQSPTFDVYGRLTLRGAGRLTNDAGTQVNTLNLRPGGNLRLDYNMDVNDSIVTDRLGQSNLGTSATENKLSDLTPLILDNAGINLINSNGRVNGETVGPITIRGGTGITLERNGTNGQIVLQTPSITRVGQATLAIRPTSASAELGSVNIQSAKLFITGTAPTQTNGIVAPWMVNLTGRNFLSYDANFGFTNAPFAVNAGVGGDAFFGATTGTTVAQYLAANSSPGGANTLTGTYNVYALRVDEFSGTVDNVFNGGQINILSGGLILGSDDTNRVSFASTNVYFGDGTTPVEGIVYAGHSTPNQFFGGVVTANNLTLDGPGGFQLTNTANAITGTIALNGGRLFLDGAGTQGTATSVILGADYANNFNGNQMADLRLRHNSATTTFNMDVTVAQNVPYAQIQAERFSGAATTTAVQFNNLNILGTDGPSGTLLRLNNSNSNTNVLGTTTIGGTSPVGMNVNTATWDLQGNITSAVPIVKTGGGVLRFDGTNTGFTGGFTLNAGEWRLNGGNSNVGGTGNVELNFGVVRMANNPANTSYFTNANQTVSVNGQVTFINDRDGGATNRVRTIGTNGTPSNNIFTTANSPYVIFQAPGFGDDFVMESQLQISGSPFFRIDSADLFLRDVVSGTGTFNKAGIWYLHFDNNAANTFSGGFNDFHGITTVRQTNATLGTGPVTVYAGAGLSLVNAANLGTGNLRILTSGTALPVIGVRTIANLNGITAAIAAPGVVSGTGNGILAIDNGQNLTTDPAMATRDGGFFNLWQIGSQDGNGTLSANSVSPWGIGGSEFRIGGGSNGITLNPGTAGSAQFAGAGNRMILGVADTVMGFGTATFGSNGDNTFDGGTLITRARNLDGGYRGFTLSVQGGANGAVWRTPLGSGRIDNFGDMRYEGASGTAANSASTNANLLVLHSGSRLRFDNGTAFTGTGGGGRWADSVGIALNSSVLDMAGGNSTSAFNSETVGDISVAGGSEVVTRRSTLAAAELIAGNLSRVGSGTLMLRHDAGLLGANTTAVTVASANVDRFLVANGASLVNNNMVDPWIVSRVDNQFLKYDATAGFQIITQGTAPANYLTSAGGTINAAALPLNNGTEILNLATAPATLGLNADVYALRTDRNINSSTDNAFNRITIRSGGLLVGSNLTASINPDLYFGSAGDGTGEALIWVNTGTLQINGAIHASQVTKAGINFLNIQSDQPQFTGNWVVNNGGLQFLTPGAPSTGQVILNGAHMTDNDTTLQLTELRYSFNSGTPDVLNWSGGKITVNDLGQIRSIAANDRIDQIPAIDLKTAGGGHEGIVFFQADASRHTLRTGTVTLFDNYRINVDATSFGPGSTSGVQLGSGTGVGGLNNQGLYDVSMSGDGILTLGDNSASFTGAHTFSVGDGTVRITHNGAFGAASTLAIVRSTGAVEIATSNFTPTGGLLQEPGSIERWAVSDARGTGNYTLQPGVHLQVMADITGTRTIDLTGGSIMGYQPLDYDEVAVIQTIRSGVTINLAANSFLGQIYPAGTSNGANSIIYDMGKLNTTTNLDPSNVGLRGSYLVIDGNITGNFDLTKTGQDVIKLAGNNSFSNLIIDAGIIQLGRDNALAVSTGLQTKGAGSSGILDLNGYNQEIASLTGPGGSINNSGFGVKTLTVNTAAPSTYNGQINGSVTLLKKGADVLTLTGTNGYQGGTIFEAGKLSVSSEANLGSVPTSTRPDALTFTGGTLQTTATMSLSGNRGITLAAAGGTIETAPGTTLTAGNVITGPGSLTKTGTGTMVATAANDFTGSTVVNAGTLAVSGSLSGTNSVQLNSGGTLLLNASNIINNAANVTLNGGRLQTGTAGTSEGAGGPGLTQPISGLGLLTLTANSTIDFNTGSAGLLSFAGLGTHTAGATLTIDNWNGNFNGNAFTAGIDGTHDRLIFGGAASSFASSFGQADISFTGFGLGYSAIQFDAGYYEIVPVPEPSTTALIGAVALCALIGYRERRRFTGTAKRGGK